MLRRPSQTAQNLKVLLEQPLFCLSTLSNLRTGSSDRMETEEIMRQRKTRGRPCVPRVSHLGRRMLKLVQQVRKEPLKTIERRQPEEGVRRDKKQTVRTQRRVVRWNQFLMDPCSTRSGFSISHSCLMKGYNVMLSLPVTLRMPLSLSYVLLLVS